MGFTRVDLHAPWAFSMVIPLHMGIELERAAVDLLVEAREDIVTNYAPTISRHSERCREFKGSFYRVFMNHSSRELTDYGVVSVQLCAQS